jgi:hypothetical protein
MNEFKSESLLTINGAVLLSFNFQNSSVFCSINFGNQRGSGVFEKSLRKKEVKKFE